MSQVSGLPLDLVAGASLAGVDLTGVLPQVGERVANVSVAVAPPLPFSEDGVADPVGGCICQERDGSGGFKAGSVGDEVAEDMMLIAGRGAHASFEDGARVVACSLVRHGVIVTDVAKLLLAGCRHG